jgi:ATPase subunit of ABC transporter with duplicated ATPase domains
MTDGDPAIPLWPDNPSGDDLLGFADIADPILEAVRREKLDPVAVGVFGDRGSGKSSVLEILAGRLKDCGDVIVVFTRPCEYDPALDAKATLIAEVLAAIEARVRLDQTRFDRVKDRFESLRRRVKWSKAVTLITKSAVTMSLPCPRSSSTFSRSRARMRLTGDRPCCNDSA